MCPLCKECPDSSTHALLECRCLKAMQIKRHDETVRKVLKALQRGGRHGSTYTVLDACRAEQLQALGADTKRLPRWLLPQEAVTDEDLGRMRPDVLRILGLPAAPTQAQIAHAMANKDQYTVQVVEVGYCADYSWREKVADKLAQHEELMVALRAAGWQVDAPPHIIVVGAAGCSVPERAAGAGEAGAGHEASTRAAGRPQCARSGGGIRNDTDAQAP